MNYHSGIIRKTNSRSSNSTSPGNKSTREDSRTKTKVNFKEIPITIEREASLSEEGSSMMELPKNYFPESTFQRIFRVHYYGSTLLDQYYTQPMLPWVISEVKRKAGDRYKEIYLEITDSSLKATTVEDNYSLFIHTLSSLSKFSQVFWDHKLFFYCVKEKSDDPPICHVFHAPEDYIVRELHSTYKEVAKEKLQHQGSINLSRTPSASVLLEVMLSNSQQFEVLYLGRIKVSCKRAPPSFIDDAIGRFKVLEKKVVQADLNQEKNVNSSRQRHSSGSSVSSLPNNLDSIDKPQENLLKKQVEGSSCDESNDSSIENIVSSGSVEAIFKESADPFDNQSSEAKSTVPFSHSLITHTQSMDTDTRKAILQDLQLLADPLTHSSTLNISQQSTMATLNFSNISSDQNLSPTQTLQVLDNTAGQRMRSYSGDGPRPPKQCSLPPYRSRVSSGGTMDIRKSPVENTTSTLYKSNYNRIMLFLIGQLELCMISPDRKQILLNKTFNDISHCSKGMEHKDHFGFICREASALSTDGYVAYVFQCQTEKVVDELMCTLKQAFQNAHKVYQSQLHRQVVCDTCPMNWYHRLCMELEGLMPDKSQCLIMSRISTMPSSDQELIMTKFQVLDVSNHQEQTEAFMNLLRNLCEQKQMKHIHGSNKNEMLDKKLVPSKFNSLRQKARKSLSNSFETILKKKPFLKLKSAASLPDFEDDDFHFTIQDNLEEEPLGFSMQKKLEEQVESPQSLRPRSSTISTTQDVHKETQKKAKYFEPVPIKGPMMNMFIKVGNKSLSAICKTPEKAPTGSWRQAIFHKVQTPMKNDPALSPCPSSINGHVIHKPQPRSREQLRDLWKKVIREQILLIRMDKENKKLQVHQDAACNKRIRLDYEEITPCLKEASQKWDELLDNYQWSSHIVDKVMLQKLVKDGIPRHKRGAIWHFLVNHYCHHFQISQQETSPVENVDLTQEYESHLNELTPHQHAILIDLGRTFPHHPYFSQPLGPGQLSLFNVLKAYSLLDREVGYCQGLSFVAGVLLMHMGEEEAFQLMKHMLFHLGFRRQYKPDMVALQVQMYQLSRLLHDLHPDLYNHFDCHEIAPTLYAAPWFLTLFASQFPLGFVARLFDIIFLQGLESIFKVALSLLGNHKELLLQCASFESIMDCLKTTIPNIDVIQMEHIFSQVFSVNITNYLHAYEVEYYVLQEEMLYSPKKDDGDEEKILKLESANKSLKRQNMEILEQLQVAHTSVSQLESVVNSYQSSLKKLELRVRSLEEERDGLVHTVVALRQKLENHDRISLSTVSEESQKSESP